MSDDALAHDLKAVLKKAEREKLLPQVLKLVKRLHRARTAVEPNVVRDALNLIKNYAGN